MDNNNVMNSRTIRLSTMKVVPASGPGSINLIHFSGVNPVTGGKIEKPETSELVRMGIISTLAVARCRDFTEVTHDLCEMNLEMLKPVLMSASVDGVNEWLFHHSQIMYRTKGWHTFGIESDLWALCKTPYQAIQNGKYCVNFRYFVASEYI